MEPNTRSTAASAGFSIAAAILTPQDRIPREALAPWAARLLVSANQALANVRRTRALVSELWFAGNNAGLIAAHRNEMQTAWRITERQVWWQGRLSRRSGDAGMAAYAVQPWVNLGRLEALNGLCDQALARFATLSTYEVADRLEIGCMQVGGSGWMALWPSGREFLDYLSAVYVIDSLKAMLLNRRYDMVRPFAERVGTESPLRWSCEEACVVAETRTGDFAGAVARAADAARQASGWRCAVLRLRLAEAHACAGEIERAQAILSQLAGVVKQVSPEVKAKPELMPITARVATACHEVGLADDACAVAREVLQGARTANDEMIQIEMLKLLANASPEHEAEEWRDAADAAVEATDYAHFRRGAPPRPNPVFDELYERLEAVYT
ncbi:MAG TPA: hypothetical protein VFS20_26535 [Longimicrobium sp.]|nr:hypothetical protein [Longimicrobium sp.]